MIAAIMRAMFAAAGLLALAAILLVLVWALQRRLLYFPIATLPTPMDASLADVEVVSFTTVDGVLLGAWFVRAAGSSPRATVLVFNGNAGNRAYRAPLAAALRQRGFHVLLMDYRGYGGNPGTPTERGLAADSRAARAYLDTRSDVDPARIVYFGESLGTAVAVNLAVDRPPAWLVLRSPFTSITDLGEHHYPFLPVRWLLRDRFPVLGQIGRVQVPVLVIAGERDRIVPIESSRRVYDAAPGPKTLLVLPDADHNDYDLLAGTAMLEAVVQSISSNLNE